MKLFSFGTKKRNKNMRRKRIFSDFAQESINNYGKQQLKSLIDRGLSVQW